MKLLMLQPFNTVPVVMPPNHKIISSYFVSKSYIQDIKICDAWESSDP